MRIEAHALFRGECEPYMPGNFSVVFNGDIIEKVMEADDVEGWVKYIKGNEITIETGKVEFIKHWE